MQIWVFSDLHLTNSESTLYQAFLTALQAPSCPNDVVVFSGDIFDLLLGNSSYFRRRYLEFFEAVDRLVSSGVTVHYIEGNHDFHIRSLFSSGVKFHDEAVELIDTSQSIANKIYIAHGDLVDLADHKYLRLRRVLRQKWVQYSCSLIPGIILQKIGDLTSRPLEQKALEAPDHWDSENLTRLRLVFRTFAKTKFESGYQFIVLGHCHDLDSVEPYYFNMGYPPIHGQYLFYDSKAPGFKRMSF